MSGFAASQGRPVGHHMRMTDSGTRGRRLTRQSTDGIAADEQLNAQVSAPAVPFGEWPSPITAAEIASAPGHGLFPDDPRQRHLVAAGPAG